MKNRQGGSAQQRRRARRAALRAQMNPRALEAATAADLAAIGELALTAGATGSTSLPLSARDASWDASAAEKTLDPGQFADAHFWRDPDGPADEVGSYKLPFATNDGGLTAVWKGVTACAGAVQGARGGVKIPAGDVAGVKSRIAGYYAKAAKKYGDDSLVVPWDADVEKGETAAILLAIAEVPGTNRVYELGADGAERLLSFRRDDQDEDALREFGARLEFWRHELAETPEVLALERLDAQLAAAAADHDRGVAVAAVESGGASVRLVVPRDAVDAASALLASRLQVAADDEQSADFAAALEARFAPFVEALAAEADQIRATFTLTDFDLVDAPAATRLPDANPSPEAPAVPEIPVTGVLRWNATIAPEGAMTDDGRAFSPGALDWRDLPLTLGAMLDTPHADMVTEARAAGRIDRIWREGSVLKAEGIFDAGDFGVEIARMVTDGTLRGVSVDTAIHSYEVGPRSQWFDADGNWLSEPPAPSDDPQDLASILFGGDDSEDPPIFVITSATIGAVTICPFAAFADAKIAVADSLVAGANPAVWTITQQAGFVVTHDASGEAALTASAALLEAVELGPAGPVGHPGVPGVPGSDLLDEALGIAPLAPPAGWFQNPNLPELTAVTIDDDGRVYGHAWGWDTCHIGYPDVCTTAPASRTSYAYFHVGEIVCADGERLSVGRITFDTGHALPGMSRAAAAAHYDDTGKVGAYVVVGEDEHGGWVAGTLAADVTAADAQKLRGSAPSGDWRDANGNLELVALLAVNVPGFPVPRPRALTASGEDGDVRLSLTAAGIVLEPDDDTLFRIGLEDAVRSGAMTAEFRDFLVTAGDTAPTQRDETIERGRQALHARRRDQEADLREMRALADQARGAFSDLALAARAEG